MDPKENPRDDPRRTSYSSFVSELSKNSGRTDSFKNSYPMQPVNKWEDSSILDRGTRNEQAFPEFIQPEYAQINGTWDPRTTLSNLSFLEQKISQLQDLVHLIADFKDQSRNDELVAQQQLVTLDLTSIIVQLISTAGSLLPVVKSNPSIIDGLLPQDNRINKGLDHPAREFNVNNSWGSEAFQNYTTEEHESKDEEEADENLPPGSYEILQIEKDEILAPHTHFCMICGKGFKRDANLRMHMRGHGDEYKTAAALAKPHKEATSEPVLIKRYSCPYAGCKRNRDHKKFQPLKTILCMKNHYKRTHCDKSYTCSRCNTKKFSVIADLKTHEKHCGRDKWLCSCGTTFSRKDKLFGHISLFQGHTPAISHDDAGRSSDAAINKVGSGGLIGDNSLIQHVMDIKGNIDDPNVYFSSMNFDTCNFGGFHEFPRPAFDDLDGSFTYLMDQKCGGELGTNDLECDMAN